MAERLADELSARIAALDARLTAAAPSSDLDALKVEIHAVFKTVEQEIADLSVVRDGVLQLVEKWKGLKGTLPSVAVLKGTVPSEGTVPSRGTAVPSEGTVPSKATRSFAGPAPAPEFSGEKPRLRADHLGASTFIEKGWSLISNGDYAGAEQALNKALQFSPNDPAAESLLGWALMLQDKYDDALLNFQKVLIREPQNALARVNVGYICLKKQIFGEAIEHLSRAIRLGTDKKAALYAHFYLGLVYLDRDMYEDAQTFLQKAIALGPNLIEAYFELGRAYWFNGQREDATDTWKAGFAANKFNPWGKRCSEVLETVQTGGEP